MAVAYLKPGVTSLADGSWSDSTGFANSATLVIQDGSQSSFGGSVDFSGLTQGIDYLRVLASFTGGLQSSSGGPLKFDADQGSEGLVSYAAAGGLMRYQAAGNSNVANVVENVGGGHLYLMGGTIGTLNLCSGETDADSSTVVTNAYVTGGTNSFEYNSTGLTIFEQTGGYTVLKRAAAKIIVNGGTLVIDFDDGANGTATYGGTSIEVNGGKVIWRNGNLDNVTWRGGMIDSSKLRRNATIGATTFVVYAGIEGYLQQPGTGAAVTWSTATKRGSAAGWVAGSATMFGG